MSTPFVSALRDAIATTMPRDAGKLAAVAARLGTSPRTVQRRLATLGLRYAGVREEVRGERARRLVANGDLPLAEIAARLGYRDAGSFTRAFRRWTGTAPQSYRRDVSRDGRRAAAPWREKARTASTAPA